MFSLAASTNKAMATICLVAMLTATVQLQHGGMCLAQTEQKGIIKCNGPPGSSGFDPGLNVPNNCDQAAAALNRLDGVTGVECIPGDSMRDYFRVQEYNCDQAAAALNRLDGVTGVECSFSMWRPEVGGKSYHFLQVPAGSTECDEVTSALSGMIAVDYTAILIQEEVTDFQPFYMAAAPITAVATLGSGYYAYNYLGGSNDALYKSILFGLFVGFRVFDLMSDWGMYSISLKTYHIDQPLRSANFVFSIIGSLLLILDLKTMRERADHWFGIEDDIESLKSVAYGMLLIVFLEDVPQLIITILYFQDMPEGREFTTDPIAMTSVVLSGISIFTNALIGFRSLC